MDKKKVGFYFIIAGFVVNFIACALLIIPFIKQETNSPLTIIGGIVYIVVAILIITGFILILKGSKEEN